MITLRQSIAEPETHENTFFPCNSCEIHSSVMPVAGQPETVSSSEEGSLGDRTRIYQAGLGAPNSRPSRRLRSDMERATDHAIRIADKIATDY